MLARCDGDAFVMSLIGVTMPTLSLLYLMMPCILQVVDAVNCARRGWVNVEMDVKACEACGARILFSTPIILDTATRSVTVICVIFGGILFSF